jgi:hypothetical protein
MQARVLTELDTRWVPRSFHAPWLAAKSRKYLFLAPLRVEIDGEQYEVPAGYVFDMSSIPRIAYLLYTPGYHEAVRAAAFHDYCYSHLWRTVSKDFADRALEALMIADGADPSDARRFYWATQLFGRGGWSHGGVL